MEKRNSVCYVSHYKLADVVSQLPPKSLLRIWKIRKILNEKIVEYVNSDSTFWYELC